MNRRDQGTSEPRSLEMEVGALAARAQTASERVRQGVRRIMARLGFQTHYRRVFCDPQTGELTHSAVAVLRDLAKVANFGRFDPRASDADLRTNEGARRVILHLFARLDLGSDELLNLSKRMRENRDE